MYRVTENDKDEILHIFLRHNCVVSMATLRKEYSYANTRLYKEQKILKVIASLDEKLKRFVRAYIIRRGDTKFELRFE